MLKHAFRVLSNHLREASKRSPTLAHLTGEGPRSSKWPKVEKGWLAKHPTCAACGGTIRMNVHHKQPFHLHPELELADGTTADKMGRMIPPNLISLCMGPLECHIRIGHGDNFRAYNPTVTQDAATVLADPSKRSEVEAKAKALRLL